MLAIVLGIAFVCGSRNATASKPTQPNELAPVVQLDIGSIQPNYAILPKGFPAVSQNRKEIAIYHTNDAMNYSATVDIISTAKNKLLKRFVLLSEREGEYGIDQNGRLVSGRLILLNNYLAKKKFISLPSLYEMKFSTNRLLTPIERFASAGKDIAFEYRTGVLTISSTQTGRIELRMRRPVIKRPGPCARMQGTPVRAWIDEVMHTVVFQIQYVGTRDSCEQPEEWAIRHLRR